MKNEFILKPEECKAALKKMKEIQAEVSTKQIIDTEVFLKETKGYTASEITKTWNDLKQCKLEVANAMERLTKKLEESIDQHIALDDAIAKELSKS